MWPSRTTSKKTLQQVLNKDSSKYLRCLSRIFELFFELVFLFSFYFLCSLLISLVVKKMWFREEEPSYNLKNHQERHQGYPGTAGKTTRKDIRVVPAQGAKPPEKISELFRHRKQNHRKDIRVVPACSKSHACHAKAAAERRSPKRAKAYIRK